MFRFILALLVLTACSSSGNSAVPACGSASSSASCLPRQVKNAKPGLGKAVIMGDSLAAGFGAEEPKNTPAGCLRSAFGEVTVDNSQPGRTSKEILMSSQASFDQKPKLIFISSGGNDVISEIYRPGSYPEKNSLDEMSQLFDRALATGALVVYLGLNPPNPGAERLPKISALASQKGVIVADGMNGFWGNKDLMSDQVHPNDKGYEIMCQRILDSVKGFYP